MKSKMAVEFTANSLTTAILLPHFYSS